MRKTVQMIEKEKVVKLLRETKEEALRNRHQKETAFVLNFLITLLDSLPVKEVDIDG